MSFYQVCPRCGSAAYERLSTHAYCVDCNYSPDFEATFDANCLPIPPWAEKVVVVMGNPKKKILELEVEPEGDSAA